MGNRTCTIHFLDTAFLCNNTTIQSRKEPGTLGILLLLQAKRYGKYNKGNTSVINYVLYLSMSTEENLDQPQANNTICNGIGNKLKTY
jgi:hypothetical protein